MPLGKKWCISYFLGKLGRHPFDFASFYTNLWILLSVKILIELFAACMIEYVNRALVQFRAQSTVFVKYLFFDSDVRLDDSEEMSNSSFKPPLPIPTSSFQTNDDGTREFISLEDADLFTEEVDASMNELEVGFV